MREVSIDAQIFSKIKNGKNHFYDRELPKNFPSLAPGEWFHLNYKDEFFTAFGNDHVKAGPKVWVLSSEKFNPNDYLISTIQASLNKRAQLYLGEGKRLVFGQNDNLPGLIVDSYEKHLIVQINTAGIDSHRELIRKHLEAKTEKKVVFLDNQAYREDESLPVYEQSLPLDEEITIVDSGFTYKMPFEKLQKLGFYFDHRDNRNKYESYLNKLKEAEKVRCLDLFCYLGAWGLHSIRAGVKQIDFVDQANLENEVLKNVSSTNKDIISRFNRADVFKYLQESLNQKRKWNVVICDPPAFCKSSKQKAQAISGYKKLYNKIFRVIESKGTLVAASCTKYVSLEEFTSLISQQAKENNRKIWLRDIGIQSMDHPISNMNDSANYIKYALYYVE